MPWNLLAAMLPVATVVVSMVVPSDIHERSLEHSNTVVSPSTHRSVAAGILAKLQRLDAQNASRVSSAASRVQHKVNRGQRPHSQHPGTAAALSVARKPRKAHLQPGRLRSDGAALGKAKPTEKRGLVPPRASAVLSTKPNKEEGAVIASQANLSEATQKTSERFLEGSALRHTIIVTEAKIKEQKRLKQEFEAQQKNLVINRDGLETKLRKLMDPKLQAAQGRLQHEEQSLAKSEEEVKEMEAKINESEAVATEKVQEAESAFNELEEADAALKIAKIREANASNKYTASRAAAAAQAQGLRDAEVRYQGVASRSQHLRGRVEEQVASVKKLETILKAEEGKVQAAYDRGVVTLNARIKQADKANKITTEQLRATKEKYKAWKEAENDRAQKEAELKAKFDEAAEANHQKQHEVWEASQAEATESAERKNAWKVGDDWAWAGPDADELVDKESLDANATSEPAPDAEADSGAKSADSAASGTDHDKGGSDDSKPSESDSDASASGGPKLDDAASLEDDIKQIDSTDTEVVVSDDHSSETSTTTENATSSADGAGSKHIDGTDSKVASGDHSSETITSTEPAPSQHEALDAFDLDYIKDENGNDVAKQEWQTTSKTEVASNTGASHSESEGHEEASNTGASHSEAENHEEASNTGASHNEAEGHADHGNDDSNNGEHSADHRAATSGATSQKETAAGNGLGDRSQASGGSGISGEGHGFDEDYVKDGNVDVVDTESKIAASGKVVPPTKASSTNDYVLDENSNAADKAWFENGLQSLADGLEDAEGEGGGEGATSEKSGDSANTGNHH